MHRPASLSYVAEYERLIERAGLVEDVHTADAQLERGAGVSHEAAKQQVLSRGSPDRPALRQELDDDDLGR